MDWAEASAHAARLTEGCIYGDGWVYERAKQAMPHIMWTVGDRRHREGWCSACEQWVDLRPDNLVPDYAIGCLHADRDYTEDFEPFMPAGMTQESYMHSMRNTSDHLTTGECPHCHAAIQYRSMHKGHRSLEHRIFLVVYGNSALDDDTLVCVGVECCVDWSCMDDYRPSLPLYLMTRELCVFKYGRGADRFVRMQRWDRDKREWVWRWEHRRECKSGFVSGSTFAFNWGARSVPVVLDKASYSEAVACTRFEAVLDHNVESTDAGRCYDRITLMARIARYPCVEYLYKLGYGSLARAVIDGRTEGLLSLRGKTAQKVLRLSADDWAEVKGKKIPLDIGTLRVLRTARDAKLRISVELCAWLGRDFGADSAIKELRAEYREVDAVKAIKYCRKHGIQHLGDYVDSLRMMRGLEMDLRDSEFVYPRDFWETHAQLSARLDKIPRNCREDVAIAERLALGKLDEYCFGALGLTMRPMLSSGEVLAEGARQSHCVGAYVSTYAEGNDVLCVLREDTAPDTPLYTVEFGKDGRLVQCRGYRNDTQPEGRERRREDADRLDMFWRLFEMMRADFRAQRAREEKKQTKGAKVA